MRTSAGDKAQASEAEVETLISSSHSPEETKGRVKNGFFHQMVGFCPGTDRVQMLFSLGMKFLGWCLGFLALFLIGMVTYCWFTDVWPFLMDDKGPIPTLSATILGIWLLFNIVFNHQMCSWTGPGFAKKIGETYPPEIMKKFAICPELAPNETARWCRTCNTYKPWRTHHCPVSGGCVLKMDHFCPWVNNCVGFLNYRYFVNFLLYLWSGTLFYMYFGYEVRFSAYGYMNSSEAFDFSYMLCMGIWCAMGLFLFMHGYLILTNQTTIEMWGRRKNRKFIGLNNIRHIYSLGCWNNLEEVWGKGAWYTWLLPSTRTPPGNGFVYPLRKEVEELLHEDRREGYLDGTDNNV